MGQEEVLEWFKTRAIIGKNNWLTFTDIRKGLKEDGVVMRSQQVNRQVRALFNHGYLESKPEHWRAEFRYPEVNQDG